MPISVQCICGKGFSAPDKLAGKRVKCPSCGDPLDIPHPAADRPELSEDDLVAGDPLDQAPAPAAPDSPLGVPLGVPLERGGDSLQPAAAVQPADAAQERTNKVKSGLLIGTLAVTLVGFVVIVVAAFMPWITLNVQDGDGQISITGFGSASASMGDQHEDLPDNKVKPDGVLVMIVAVLGILGSATVFASLLPALANTLNQKFQLIALLSLLGCGIFLLVWHVAWIWKNVSLSGALHERSFPFGVFPGMGLFFAVGGAIAVAGATSFVASKLTARKWLYMAEGAGAALGLIVLAALVGPWTAEEMAKDIFELLGLPRF